MDSVAKLLQQAARAEASPGGSPARPSQGGMQQASSSGQSRSATVAISRTIAASA